MWSGVGYVGSVNSCVVPVLPINSLEQAEQHRHFGIDTQSQQLHEHTIVHGELIPWETCHFYEETVVETNGFTASEKKTRGFSLENINFWNIFKIMLLKSHTLNLSWYLFKVLENIHWTFINLQIIWKYQINQDFLTSKMFFTKTFIPNSRFSFNTNIPSMGRLYIYQHENHKKSTIHVGTHTSPMDGMG